MRIILRAVRTATLFVGILLTQMQSLAAYVLNELPGQFTPNSASMSVKTLGGSCYALAEIQDGAPCAASFLALVKRPRFFGTALVGNGYDAVKTTNDVLYKPLSRGDLENLFSEKSYLEAAGSVKLTFLAPHFAAQFTPYEATLNSIIRNASYPVVGIHAINERSLRLSWGSELWKNILAGSHLRIFERRFVHDEFQMFQAITNSGALLKPHEQTGFSLDPSLTWWFDNPWQFRWTLGVENLGWVNKSYSEMPFQPQFTSGIGVATPLSLGLLEMGLDLRMPRDRSLALNDFMFGSNYRFGALQFLAGINERYVAGGIRFALRNIDLGVSYTTTQWPSGSLENYQQSLMTQIGLGF